MAIVYSTQIKCRNRDEQSADRKNDRDKNMLEWPTQT